MHFMPGGKSFMRHFLRASLVFIYAAMQPAGAESASVVFPDAAGLMETKGKIDVRNAFFRDLGTNGRSCATCHQFSDGMTVTPEHIRLRFRQTGGTDPIFRPVDGANCDKLDVSTQAARQSAYSLLLNKGLIRVTIDVPANEFAIPLGRHVGRAGEPAWQDVARESETPVQ
jgi:hypothetical protein